MSYFTISETSFLAKQLLILKRWEELLIGGIVYGEENKDVNSKKPGGTAEGINGELVVKIHSSVFLSGADWAKNLALVLGHELVHARDIANGNVDMWRLEFVEKSTEDRERIVEIIMEVHAWEWTLQAERNPRINTIYGEGASIWLEKLRPQLPERFSFKNANR